MHDEHTMLFTYTVIPLGAGDDISGPVAESVATLQESGLPHQVTGASTLIEGRWSDVMPVIERSLHELTERHPRVYATVTLDFHAGREDRLRSSIERVQRHLREPVRSAP
jgi:uncharacterized protein YqgV (UPF0045/DUF77 family)